MIMPIRLNDHYFIAWLNKVKQIEYHIINNHIVIFIEQVKYDTYLTEYENTHKPLLKEIRKTVKLLNRLVTK